MKQKMKIEIEGGEELCSSVKFLHLNSDPLLKFSEPDKKLKAVWEQCSVTVTFPDRAILCISVVLIVFKLTATV